jgi:hypothetical protein
LLISNSSVSNINILNNLSVGNNIRCSNNIYASNAMSSANIYSGNLSVGNLYSSVVYSSNAMSSANIYSGNLSVGNNIYAGNSISSANIYSGNLSVGNLYSSVVYAESDISSANIYSHDILTNKITTHSLLVSNGYLNVSGGIINFNETDITIKSNSITVNSNGEITFEGLDFGFNISSLAGGTSIDYSAGFFEVSTGLGDITMDVGTGLMNFNMAGGSYNVNCVGVGNVSLFCDLGLLGIFGGVGGIEIQNLLGNITQMCEVGTLSIGVGLGQLSLFSGIGGININFGIGLCELQGSAVEILSGADGIAINSGITGWTQVYGHGWDFRDVDIGCKNLYPSIAGGNTLNISCSNLISNNTTAHNLYTDYLTVSNMLVLNEEIIFSNIGELTVGTTLLSNSSLNICGGNLNISNGNAFIYGNISTANLQVQTNLSSANRRCNYLSVGNDVYTANIYTSNLVSSGRLSVSGTSTLGSTLISSGSLTICGGSLNISSGNLNISNGSVFVYGSISASNIQISNTLSSANMISNNSTTSNLQFGMSPSIKYRNSGNSGDVVIVSGTLDNNTSSNTFSNLAVYSNTSFGFNTGIDLGSSLAFISQWKGDSLDIARPLGKVGVYKETNDNNPTTYMDFYLSTPNAGGNYTGLTKYARLNSTCFSTSCLLSSTSTISNLKTNYLSVGNDIYTSNLYNTDLISCARLSVFGTSTIGNMYINGTSTLGSTLISNGSLTICGGSLNISNGNINISTGSAFVYGNISTANLQVQTNTSSANINSNYISVNNYGFINTFEASTIKTYQQATISSLSVNNDINCSDLNISLSNLNISSGNLNISNGSAFIYGNISTTNLQVQTNLSSANIRCNYISVGNDFRCASDSYSSVFYGMYAIHQLGVGGFKNLYETTLSSTLISNGSLSVCGGNFYVSNGNAFIYGDISTANLQVQTNLSSANIRCNYLSVGNDLRVQGNAFIYGNISTTNLQVQTNLSSANIRCNYLSVGNDLRVQGNAFIYGDISTTNLQVQTNTSSANIRCNYLSVGNDLRVQGNSTIGGVYISGNFVGINQTGPTYNLDVNGSAHITNYLYMDSAIYMRWWPLYLRDGSSPYDIIVFNGSDGIDIGGTSIQTFKIGGNPRMLLNSTSLNLSNTSLNISSGNLNMSNGNITTDYLNCLKLIGITIGSNTIPLSSNFTDTYPIGSIGTTIGGVFNGTTTSNILLKGFTELTSGNFKMKTNITSKHYFFYKFNYNIS